MATGPEKPIVPLLFINQTKESLLDCNKAANRRQVNQHVQKRRYGAKRQQPRMTIKNIPLGWLRDKPSDECLSTATDSEPSAEDNRIASQQLSQLPPRASNQATKRRPPFGLTKSICSVQIDHLESYDIKAGTGEHVSRLLDFYIQVFGPIYVWPSEMVITAGLRSLQSVEEKRLFDIVDKLRLLDINHELDLPQLVVCGSQSSGKSSVLEAISELPFPRADMTCTRFVTE
jgi:Dynamin family